MYEEKKRRFNWKRFILRLLFLILIIFLIIKLLPTNINKETNGHSKIFNTNFTKFKEVGNNYFTKDKLPSEGEETKVSLKELVKNNKISTLKGADKKACNEDKSYIRAYKKNIGYELEVYLECGKESDKSYIYLGCFDDCEVTTKNSDTKEEKTTKKKEDKESKTTSTKTTKESQNETTKKVTTTSSKTTSTTKKTTTTTKKTTSTTTKKMGTGNKTSSYKTTTKKVTTTTTKVKTYAVIFNENGGSKVTTQMIVAGENAIKPSNPTKNGFIFKGWYLNGVEYNFNSPVNSNVILMAKWEVASSNITYSDTTVATKTYKEVVYSSVSLSEANNSVSSIDSIRIPSALESAKNVSIKDVTYIRNFNSSSDINMVSNSLIMDNFGKVNNIKINKNANNRIYWSGLVQSSCKTQVDNLCSYGVVYQISWEYEI